MKKIFLLVSVFVITLSALSAAVPFVESGVLITVGDEIYAKMDALFILSGKSVPSTSRPWTVAEARNYLLILDSNVPEKYMPLYDELYEYLFVEDRNTLSLTLSLSPEAYAHTNSSYNREEFWLWGYSRRSHFAKAALDNSTHGIYGHFELSLGRGMVESADASSAVTIKEYVESMGKTWDGIGTMIRKDEGDKPLVITTQKAYTDYFSFNMTGLNDIDLNMPRHYYLDYANTFMSVGMYKAQKTWGYNRSGNFIFDSHNDYYHTLSMKTYSRSFNFEYTLMLPETYRGGSNYYLNDGEETRRVFAAHRIEFRLFDRINVVLSENTMYRFSDYFDFSTLNPAAFWHNNVNNVQFNSLAHVEFEWSIIPSLLLYGSWVIDQGSMPGLEDRSKEDQAMGFSLGLEYDRVIRDGVARFSFEGIYTNPALYRPTGSSDFIINYNAVNEEDYYRYPFFTYIGYKYGGDTISLRFDADYRKNSLHLYSYFELRFDGEFTLYDQYYAPLLKTAPSGDYETVFTFNLGGDYTLTLSKASPVKALIDVTLINSSKRGFDAQFTLGASISYSLKTN